MKMKQIFFSFLIGIMITSIAAETALGAIINPNRPWGTTASLNEVQTVFTAIGSSLDPVADQTGYGYFEPAGAGNSTAAYIATVSWGWPELEFGIYDLDDPTNMVKLFDESLLSAGDSVLINFSQTLNSIVVSDVDTLVVVDSTTYFREFGFYAITTTSVNPETTIGPFYSEDSLNPGGWARFLTYEAKGDMVTIGGEGPYNDAAHWYIATEAGSYGAGTTWGADFSDFIVQMQSIVPVPVPAAILLGILGLSVAGIKLRKYA